MHKLRADPGMGFASYADECLAWRQSLPEDTLRSLASDYLRGMVDPCTSDAYLEYESRWGTHVRGTTRLNKRPFKARPRRIR